MEASWFISITKFCSNTWDDICGADRCWIDARGSWLMICDVYIKRIFKFYCNHLQRGKVASKEMAYLPVVCSVPLHGASLEWGALILDFNRWNYACLEIGPIGVSEPWNWSWLAWTGCFCIPPSVSFPSGWKDCWEGVCPFRKQHRYLGMAWTSDRVGSMSQETCLS